MKKIIKIILTLLIVVAVVAGIVYIKSQPLSVEATKVSPQDVEMYFIEKGEAVSEKAVQVNSLISGKIKSLEVKEGSTIKKGDVICVIDSSDIKYQIESFKSSSSGYEAQKNNLSLQESKEKDSLTTNKNDLLAQLKTLEAKKNSTDLTKTDQEKLQSVINEQYQDNLKFAQEQLATLQDDYKKLTTLYDNGVVSKNDLDEAKRGLDSAQKAVDDAMLAIEQGNKQLEIIKTNDPTSSEDYYKSMRASIEAQIKGVNNSLTKSYTSYMSKYYESLVDGNNVNIESLENKIKDYTITSPVSGKITTLNIENSNIVNATDKIAIIEKTKEDEIEVYVTTMDIDKIKNGDEVGLILKRRDEDKVLTGKIIKIDDKAETKVSTLGIDEKRVKVTVLPSNPKEFKSGYDVDVKFVYYKDKNKITVPKTAVFKVDEKDYVWIIKKNLLSMQEVKKGKELRTNYVIESGISQNDLVIKEANKKELKAGIKVATS